jgi:hypothetical protein
MNKKWFLGSLAAALVLALTGILHITGLSSKENFKVTAAAPKKQAAYIYPSFYRGIYLTNDSANSEEKLNSFISESKKSGINTFVMDAQSARGTVRIVSRELLQKCIDNGLHPIARVVVFPGGLSAYPPPEKKIDGIIDIAVQAAEAGFKEIQFDYIRFSDENRHVKNLRGVSLVERYAFIESFFDRAKKKLAPYNVRVAADVFGRVPHNDNDRIGQKMEVFDKIVDVICPMAYPSHYWTKKLRNDPYGTVKWTSSEANRRTQKADVVTYIQAFKMCHPAGISFLDYIKVQIKAVHDSNIKGFLMWNARQDYSLPLRAVTEYYSNKREDKELI